MTSIAVWGNPDSPSFVRDYLTTVTFMGHRLTWHKWAVAPLMAAQADIVASGTGYRFYDCQTYCNRNIVGSSTKSNHAWAIAMDINPAENPMGSRLITDIPMVVREAFKAHGFRWGGDYIGRIDAMHFEYMGDPVKGATTTEDEDMTKDQEELLKRGRVSQLAQSYDLAIVEAKMDAIIAAQGIALPQKVQDLELERAKKVAAEKTRLGL